MLEKSLLILKPDAVARGLVGEIIARFEKRGFEIKNMKLMHIGRAVAENHYIAHEGKPFLAELIDYIISGPSVVLEVEGENAIKAIRLMVGATNPADAHPGTIRGDLALDISNNVIHASDSLESAEREIMIFFG